MLIWTGHGYLVAAIVFFTSLLMELTTESIFQDDAYYQREAWPLALALAISAVLCFLIGVKLDSAEDRVLVDPETGEEVVVSGGSHTLFFVKMHWWGAILLAFAVLVLFRRLG